MKRKVYLDLFASPGTLLPVAAGITALLGSWAMDGNSWLNFAGLTGILSGMGILATRLILGLDKITEQAYAHLVNKQRQDQQQSLDRLHARLMADEDPRTQNCLTELRHLYERLKDEAADEPVNAARYGVIEGVDQLFHTTIDQLVHSVELWETARTMRGSARQSILQQRDELVREICLTVDHLGKTVDRFHAMTTNKNRGELARLRQELDRSLQVAREVERRTVELTDAQLPATPDLE